MSASNRPPSVYVDDVFEEVLALPKAQREAAIEERCAGHPSLASEVRALLAAEEAHPEPSPDVVRAGAKLGRYQLDACLGKGASASVWKAWDTHLRAWTALKLIHSDIRHREDALQTVLHEARAASAIISDHVVRIKSAGKIPTGPYYVEMQLCAEQSPDSEGHEALVIGRSLAEVKPESIVEAARLVMEAARGAEAAHRVGVLHRDIKPANILLMPISRRALVADFGLSAANFYPEPTPSTPSTATVTIHLHDGGRVLVGTPSFMPPEQAWGEPATRTNDVYALGATLYALIARRAPYQPSGQRPLPALEVVRQVREGPPRPLQWAAKRVPGQLVRIVEKAMAREPSDRYPTAAALADDLQAYLETMTTTQDSYRPWLRGWLWAARNKAWLSVGALSACLLAPSIAGVVALELRRVELKEEVQLAVQRRAAAESLAREAEMDQAEAEAAREIAITEREKANKERDIANEASALAQQGEKAAVLRARQEIEARMAAEEDRLTALQLKIEAEEELSRNQKIRDKLDEELVLIRGNLTEQMAKVQWLEGELEREVKTNQELMGDIETLDSEVIAMRGRIGMLETQLELAKAGAAEAVKALEEAEKAAPWMNEEPVPEPVGPVESAPVEQP